MKKISSLILLTTLNIAVFSQDFDTYGKEHNDALRLILPKIDNSVSAKNVFDATVGIINSTFSKPVTHYRFKDYSDPLIMLNELLSKGSITDDLYQLVKKDLNNTFTMDNSISIDSYVQQTKASKSYNNLVPGDQQKYLAFLSTMKHSSYFWDVSGENGRQYLNSNTTFLSGPSNQFYERDDSAFMLINWWKVLGCDCVGAIVSLGNPIAAAGSSVCSIIGQS